MLYQTVLHCDAHQEHCLSCGMSISTALGGGAAKEFTHEKRNQRVGGIKQANHTAQSAIHRIRQAYGFDQSVTPIINRMLYDRRTRGGHPNRII